MISRPLRAVAVAATLTLTLVGCSGSSSDAEKSPVVLSAAQQLEATQKATRAVTSFEFRSVTEIVPRKEQAADAASRTLIEGRAALPDKVAYTVAAGTGGAEVVNIGDASYTRTLPGGAWKAAADAPATSPGSVLVAVLDLADSPVIVGPVTFDGKKARQFTVDLTADEIRSTGLLDAAGGSPATLQIAVDSSNRVIRLGWELPVSVGDGVQADLRQVITYGTFDKAAEIKAPAVG